MVSLTCFTSCTSHFDGRLHPNVKHLTFPVTMWFEGKAAQRLPTTRYMTFLSVTPSSFFPLLWIPLAVRWREESLSVISSKVQGCVCVSCTLYCYTREDNFHSIAKLKQYTHNDEGCLLPFLHSSDTAHNTNVTRVNQLSSCYGAVFRCRK